MTGPQPEAVRGDDPAHGPAAELVGKWPPHAPDGICICHEDTDGRLHIGHTDPRIVISSEVIEQAASGRHDCVELTQADYTRPGGHVGALLKIRGVNRQVIYRLTEWLPSIRAYIGEWPE